MRFMLSQSPAQVSVKYVSVQCKGGLFLVLYGILYSGKFLKDKICINYSIGIVMACCERDTWPRSHRVLMARNTNGIELNK